MVLLQIGEKRDPEMKTQQKPFLSTLVQFPRTEYRKEKMNLTRFPGNVLSLSLWKTNNSCSLPETLCINCTLVQDIKTNLFRSKKRHTLLNQFAAHVGLQFSAPTMVQHSALDTAQRIFWPSGIVFCILGAGGRGQEARLLNITHYLEHCSSLRSTEEESNRFLNVKLSTSVHIVMPLEGISSFLCFSC